MKSKYSVELSYTVPEDVAQRILREYDEASSATAVPGLWATNSGITVAVQVRTTLRRLLDEADDIAADLVATLTHFGLPMPWRVLVTSFDGLEADVREARGRSDLSPLFIEPNLSDDEAWELFHALGSN